MQDRRERERRERHALLDSVDEALRKLRKEL
jgi:hypothetical protein